MNREAHDKAILADITQQIENLDLVDDDAREDARESILTTVETLLNRLSAASPKGQALDPDLLEDFMEDTAGDGECRFPKANVRKLIAEIDRLRASPKGQVEAVAIKPLEWEEVTAARSDEDPTREHTGDYETTTPFGTYYVEQYFGSDSYGWEVTMNGYEKIADKDDPDAAKAAAQADFEARIRSALSPAPSGGEVEQAAWALVGQLRAVMCHLNGQAYSSTLSALNLLIAKLEAASPSQVEG